MDALGHFVTYEPSARERARLWKNAAADMRERVRSGLGPRDPASNSVGPRPLTSSLATFDFAARQFAPGPAQRREEILPFIEYAAADEPRTICEIGTQDCGNLFLLAWLLNTAKSALAVDVEFRNAWKAERLLRNRLELRFFRGSSQASGTFDSIKRALRGRHIDLLFVDGDHSLAGASRDFLNYRSLVRPGGLVAFHDIVPDHATRLGINTGSYAGDVPELWSVLRTRFSHQEFIADPNQDGRGIGCLVNDPKVRPPDEILIAAGQ